MKHQESSDGGVLPQNCSLKRVRTAGVLYEVMMCVPCDSLDPKSVSSQIPISRCLCERQEQKLLTHWPFCPQDQPFLLQSWCPHYQDGDTKVPGFIPNKPAAHWLLYLLIWRESPIFIRSTCTLPSEIIFNIRKRAFGGFIFAAWNQQVIFVFSQFSSVAQLCWTLCNPSNLTERLTLSLSKSLQAQVYGLITSILKFYFRWKSLENIAWVIIVTTCYSADLAFKLCLNLYVHMST